MEKLVNKFIDISEGSDYTMGYFNAEDIAEEVKKIAIEFAKKLMETKITMLRGMSDKSEIRNSPDYALIKGELIINGDKLFEQFIEEYYV
jgi:hypothetical protein